MSLLNEQPRDTNSYVAIYANYKPSYKPGPGGGGSADASEMAPCSLSPVPFLACSTAGDAVRAA